MQPVEVEQAVDRPGEELAGRQAVGTLVAAGMLAAVAGLQSERSAGHLYIAAQPIW